MSVLMIEESWRLFEQIWETRNNILHGKDNHTTKAEDGQLFRKLLDYQRRQHILLHYGDRIHISYPTGVIASWDRKKKKRVVRLLDSLHRIFVRDSALEAEGQKKLTSYGFTIAPPEENSDEDT